MTPACRLCGCEQAAPHHAEAGCRYYKCARCGFVYLFPAPTLEELHRLYEEEVGATFHHGAEIAAAYEKRLEARLRLRVVGIALRSAPERTVLELGCGAGYLIGQLRKSGWSVAGTEMSEDYIRFAKETLRLPVTREIPSGPFGAVALFNVLSHLPDPERDLASFRDRLIPGGVLILETGNAAEVPPWRVGPFGAPEHIWHFSESTLRAMLGRLGFRDVRVRRFNVEWQRRTLRLLGRVRSKPAPAAPSRSPAPAPPSAKRDLIRRVAAHVLLGLRFGMGRVGADRRHFCTLFVTCRKPGGGAALQS